MKAKLHWKTTERPYESYPNYYYGSYNQDIPRFKQKVELSRSKCIECSSGVYEILEDFTHIDISYDQDCDGVVTLSLYFIKCAPDEEVPNYEQRLAAHEEKKRVAKEKADKALEEWQKWRKQEEESKEYQRYLALRDKYDPK